MVGGVGVVVVGVIEVVVVGVAVAERLWLE